MIILIGGASCVGKTLLAQRLVQRYAFSCISLDLVKMGLIRSGMDCGFTAESRDSVISKKLWPIVKGIIMTAAENRQNLIIEGCYLPPDKLAALPEEYRQQLISVYLAFSYDYAVQHYSDILAHRSVAEQRRYEELRSAKEIAEDNERTALICAQSGAKCFVIRRDYNSELAAVIDWVTAEAERRKENI